jgi:hypothetical protein
MGLSSSRTRASSTNAGERAGLRDVPGMHVLGRSPESPLVIVPTDDVRINGVVCWRSSARFAANDYLVPESLGFPLYVKTEGEDETADRTVVLERIGGSLRVRLLAGPELTDSEREETVRVLRAFEESVTNDALARNAPQDQPLGIGEREGAAFEAAIAHYVALAQKSYPEAKRRFELGLPAGQSFFITTRLQDSRGRFEQVFIRVQSIERNRVIGVIASDLQMIEGYTAGQAYSFDEGDLLDWLIAKPDGSEEGNFVGKFLDTYQR